jgi:hypothetical protein
MRDFSIAVRSAAGIASGVLGWRPEEFWSATLMELQTALDGRLGEAMPPSPVDAGDLARLRERFPDG